MSKEKASVAVRAHGRDAVSFQALTADCLHWFSDAADAGSDGCVAYVDTGNAWVAVGSPLVAPGREQAVATEFARAAHAAGRRARFFATEQAWAVHREVEADRAVAGSSWDTRFALMPIGEQPVWDPADWPHGLSDKLRTQIRQHQARGRVRVRELGPEELAEPQSPARRGIDAVMERWLASRKMAPMGFLVRLNLYEQASARRYFVAEHGGQIACVMIAMPVPARAGWLLETCMRDPSAPSGAMELVFDFAMRSFAAERCGYVSYGLCPLSGTASPLHALIRRSARSLYDFDGLRHFKGKLGPTHWQPVYLTYPRFEPGALALLDIVDAFCPGGMLAFGSRTLSQRALGRASEESKRAWARAREGWNRARTAVLESALAADTTAARLSVRW